MDLGLLTTAVITVVVAADRTAHSSSDEGVVLVLALLAAAVAATAAMLAVLAARLTADTRTGWLGLLLCWYGLFTVPATTLGMLEPGTGDATGAVRLLVHGLVVGLLVVAVAAPDPPRGRNALWALLGTAGVLLVTGWWGAAYPAVSRALVADEPLQMGLDVAWTGLAITIAVIAATRGDRATWRVGLGLAVLGVAHLGPAAAGTGGAAELALTFVGVCLVGLAMALWGAVNLARDALIRVDDERQDHEEELRLVELRLARAAERDHELRNGLAGLAGATGLLKAEPPEADAAVLGTAVAAELDRLDGLLAWPAGVPEGSASDGYAVEPVLTGLVALRRSSGMDLVLDVEAGLRARGSSTVLAQVITNVLGNAARHAPGSPVDVSATRDGDEVVIRVRDYGPGVAPGLERAVFERGVRDGSASGLGLGLHISRQLLAGQAGTIVLGSPADGPGCTVVVRVPAAPAPVRRSALREQRVWSAVS